MAGFITLIRRAMKVPSLWTWFGIRREISTMPENRKFSRLPKTNTRMKLKPKNTNEKRPKPTIASVLRKSTIHTRMRHSFTKQMKTANANIFPTKK